MYNIFRKKSQIALMIGILLFILTFGESVIFAQQSNLVNLLTPERVVVNSGFISPLVELFGDVSVGRKIFIAGNTILRADPGTRICIGSETNLQDNIIFLALRNQKAPAA